MRKVIATTGVLFYLPTNAGAEFFLMAFVLLVLSIKSQPIAIGSKLGSIFSKRDLKKIVVTINISCENGRAVG